MSLLSFLYGNDFVLSHDLNSKTVWGKRRKGCITGPLTLQVIVLYCFLRNAKFKHEPLLLEISETGTYLLDLMLEWLFISFQILFLAACSWTQAANTMVLTVGPGQTKPSAGAKSGMKVIPCWSLEVSVWFGYTVYFFFCWETKSSIATDQREC